MRKVACSELDDSRILIASYFSVDDLALSYSKCHNILTLLGEYRSNDKQCNMSK